MQDSSVIPCLTVDDAESAIAFYTRVFGAKETGPRLTRADGAIVHTELLIGNAVVMLAEPMPESGGREARPLGGTRIRLALTVENADEVVDTAIKAGAHSLLPVEDRFYGQRAGRIEDPFGHVWVVSHVVETLSEAEMQRRLDAVSGDDG